MENTRIKDDFIQTYTGKHVYIMNPTEDSICIEDIAHALSMQCRFTGHINKFYSVAEHSSYVSELCKKENQLAGLMHDASEAYIVDIASPFKPFLSNYKDIENNFMQVIAKKFGFEWPMNNDIKEADIAQLKAEALELLNAYPEWVNEKRYNTVKIGTTPFGLDPTRAKQLFLNCYKQYTKD